MELLKNLYERSTGYDVTVNYDSVLDRFRCISPEPSDLDESRLFTCAFAKKPKNGHILASTRENGEVVISNTKLLRLERDDYHRISKTHDNAVYSMAWSGMDMTLVTASGDHSARVWNVSDDGTLDLLDTFTHHGKSIKTVCFKQYSNNVFATGGYDGNIFVWDVRTVNKTPDQHIHKCHKNGIITSLKFQDEMKIISCSNLDSCIKVWDLRKTYLRTRKKSKPVHEIEIRTPGKSSKGYNHLVIDANATRLYARCFDHSIYRFNLVNYSSVPDSKYVGHTMTGRYDKFSLSPDERYLASTGMEDGDATIFVWRTDSPKEPLVKFSADNLTGLSDISWCPENELLLATSSDDPLPWIWSVPPLNDVEHGEKKFWRVNSSSLSSGNNNIPSSCVKRLYVKKGVNKRVSAMAKTFASVQLPISELRPLPTLPNGYQLHVCEPVEKRKQILWLNGGTEVKELITPKGRRSAPVKRKSSVLASPCNSLDRYFKRPKNET